MIRQSQVEFDEQLLLVQHTPQEQLSVPMPQFDVLAAGGKPSWMTVPSAKRAIQDMAANEEGAAGAAGNDDLALNSELIASAVLAQYLRPPERVLAGELNRKLCASMRNGDETVRVCNDDANYSEDALDYLVPVLPALPPPKVAKTVKSEPTAVGGMGAAETMDLAQ